MKVQSVNKSLHNSFPYEDDTVVNEAQCSRLTCVLMIRLKFLQDEALIMLYNPVNEAVTRVSNN